MILYNVDSSIENFKGGGGTLNSEVYYFTKTNSIRSFFSIQKYFALYDGLVHMQTKIYNIWQCDMPGTRYDDQLVTEEDNSVIYGKY